jgi:2,3-bisphosphoglycerate-independent phosphoglycerate mutase
MGKSAALADKGMMSHKLHVLMLFLDGVGVGKKDAKHNPFFAVKMKTLQALIGGSVPHLGQSRFSTKTVSYKPINATLGVSGLPQSGTGQTSLLTGINAAREIGKHFGPYLYSTLRPIIHEQNIFRHLHRMGKKVYYANAFPKQFFDYIKAKPTRITATTLSWSSTDFKLNGIHELANGEALSADITNERWHSLGYPKLPIITAKEAGERLARITKEYDFVLYEYYFTDHAGHSQSMKRAADVLEKIDQLLEGIMSAFHDESMLLIVTSDHGNLEDLSTKSHTRNRVPLLAVGKGHRQIVSAVRDITHVAPAILKLFE